jgi:Flp pilus assembly protein TadD
MPRISKSVAHRTSLAATIMLALGLAGCGQAPNPATPSSSELTPDARLRVAQAAEQGGDRELALSMYVSAADNKPHDINLQIRTADALARAGQTEQARALLERRLTDNPTSTDLRRTLAMLDVVSGQAGPAVPLLDAVLAGNPRDVQALVAKGVALDLLKRHGDAQSVYRQALAQAPNDAIVLNDLALSLMLEGRVQEAQQAMAPLRDAGGLPDRVKATLGILYAMEGDRARSEQVTGGKISGQDLQQIATLMQQGSSGAHPVP